MIRAICLLVLAEASWLRDLWDAQGFDGSQSLSWPAAVSFERLLDEFVPAAERDHFAVNIGGQDGKSHDPVYPLFALRGYRGVVFEAFPPPALFTNIRAVNTTGGMHVSVGLVKGATIGALLGPAHFAAPTNFDVLKIDIDSIDLPVLRAVLAAGFRPKTLMVEINQAIPPPLSWTRLERTDGRAAEDHDTARHEPVHFFGASANALFVTLEAAGYALVAFEFGSDDTACDTCEHNAWAVRADLLRARGFEPPDWHAMNKAYWKQHFALSNRAVLREQGGKVDAHLQWRPGWRLSQVRSAARLACGHEGKLPKGHESEHGWRSLADCSALLASPQDFAVARQYGKRVSARLCGGAQKLGRVAGKDAADACALDAEMVTHTTPTGLSHDARAAICAALEMP